MWELPVVPAILACYVLCDTEKLHRQHIATKNGDFGFSCFFLLQWSVRLAGETSPKPGERVLDGLPFKLGSSYHCRGRMDTT